MNMLAFMLQCQLSWACSSQVLGKFWACASSPIIEVSDGVTVQSHGFLRDTTVGAFKTRSGMVESVVVCVFLSLAG